MVDNSPEKSLLSQDKLYLKSWGLPGTILEKYASKGIQSMFPWQVDCLTCDGVLSGRNLVYSAPTSAGKTMVAEILTIQTVLERKKKVIIILPFISVVREKMLYFHNLLGSSGVRVAGFMGSHAPAGGLRSVHIAICTIEKANSLINRLLEDHGLEAVGCVVVDEIHLLGDPHRGYLLELLLTKLKYMCMKDNSLRIQIVGMSATLPNLPELAKWLDAALYTTDFRPVPLAEYLKVNNAVYDAATMELKYNIKPIAKFKSDPGDVFHLCLQALLDGHSVLVFCPTRGWCETCAQQVAAEFRRIGYEKSEMGLAVRAQLDGNALGDVLEQLKRCPAGLDSALGRSVAFGVGFHHAGLTMDERDIVEGAFRSAVLRVLVATSTVSSGVNLPARRVIIRCPPRNNAGDILTYRQMVGRAGRMGKDTEGESFLICNGSERTQGEALVRAALPAVRSSLGHGDLSASLKRAVLEVIASGVVNTTADVEAYTQCTFLASTADEREGLEDPLSACVEYLQANEFIRVDGPALGPTPLAEACLSASIPPEQGLRLLKELHRARQCFVLESELHVIYQVTPYSVSEQWGQLDWLRVLSLWEQLPLSMKRVGELVGVEERFLVRAVRGTVNMQAHDTKLSIHRRFYTALALQDLVNEVPLAQVAVKFDCSKGLLQSLQQSASTFAGMVTQFTRRLGWSNVELLVSQFAARLQFGAQRELLDLLRLDCLTAVQARALYNAGIQALADLATASVTKVERALARATPFQGGAEDGDVEGEGRSSASDKCRIWLVGRCAASEAQAANILVQEARQYLERELGLQSANWGDLNSSQDSVSSDSSLTQPVRSPLQPIGLESMAAARNKIKEGDIPPEPPTEPSLQTSVQPSIQTPLQLPEQTRLQPPLQTHVQPSIQPPVQPSIQPTVQPSIPVQKSVQLPVQTQQTPVQSPIQLPVQTPVIKCRTKEEMDVRKHSSLSEENGGSEKTIPGDVVKLHLSSTKEEINIVLSENFEDINNKVKDVQKGNEQESIRDSEMTKSTIHNGSPFMKVKKRESLDLFESPEMVDINIDPERIEVKNDKKTKLLDCNKQLFKSPTVINSKLKHKNVNKLDHITMDKKIEESNSKSKPQAKRLGFSLLQIDNSLAQQQKDIVTSTPNDQLKDYSSVFFDSPLEVAMDHKSSFLKDLDEHFCNESALEMSSFVVGTEERHICEGEENIFDANFGGDSLLEISSFIAKSVEKKRKRSIEEVNSSKRLKTQSPRNVKEPKINMNLLQISKIISCPNLIDLPNKTSTPTLSKYFEGSIHLDSPFFKDENIDCSGVNDVVPSPSNDMQMPTSDVSLKNTDKSSSLKLELSENDFLCDTYSKSCDILDCKNDSDAKVESSNPNASQRISEHTNFNKLNESGELSFSDSVNIDSQLNALLDVKTSLISEDICVKIKGSSSENKIKGNDLPQCPFSDSVVVDSKLDDIIDVNTETVKLNSNVKDSIVAKQNCVFGNSLDIDSKLYALIDGNVNERNTNDIDVFKKPNDNKPILKDGRSVINRIDSKLNVLEGKSEKTSSESNLFTSNLNLNTQLCGILDQGNLKNANTNNYKSIVPTTPNELMNSNFDIGTQLCNILDNNGTVKDSKVAQNRTPIWTESMEVKEILNMTFDEDTIFGTPVNHQKSVSFKNVKKIKHVQTKTEKVKVEFDENKLKPSNKGVRSNSIQTMKNKNPNSLEQLKKEEKKIVLNSAENIPLKLSKVETEQQCRDCNSLTDSVLEAAFQASFNQEPKDDEVASSQKTSDTPNKTFRERIQNIDSPTVNMNRTQVEVISIVLNEPNTWKEFQKSAQVQKSIALALTLRSKEEEGRGVIGAKIMKKKTDNLYPCCHQGTAITEVIVCWDESKIYSLPLDQENSTANVSLLRSLLSRRSLEVRVWEARRTLRLLMQCCHLPTDARLTDPTVAEWLVKPHVHTPTLKQMARSYGVSAPRCSSDTGFQALLVWRICPLLKNQLKKIGLYNAFSDIEMPTQRVLAGMEVMGIRWDRQYVELLWNHTEEAMTELQSELYSLAGRKFNLRSYTDLAKIKSSMKTGNEEVISEFNSILRNWRVLNSLKTRNMSPLLMTEGQKVCGLWETHTVTGRISMQEPSLQHVPRDIVLGERVFSLRSAFVADTGSSVVSADFCQLELRLLAHFSQDPALLNTFAQPGDIFTTIAAEWNNLPHDQVTDSVRQCTKQLCYGLVYGMGLRTLAEEMGVEQQKAAEMVESFHQRYPGVQAYVSRCVDQCRARGYVTTVTGRRRHLPDITSHNKSLRAQAERQAVNTTIQGSAADIAKAAMLRVHDTARLRKLQAHLIIHLHDELIYEVVEKDAESFAQILRKEMEGAISLSVPLPVKVKKGPSWGQLELID